MAICQIITRVANFVLTVAIFITNLYMKTLKTIDLLYKI